MVELEMVAAELERRPLSVEEERRWAAIAWALSGPFGPVIPGIVFAVYRRRSAFVAWHALQAACSYMFLLGLALLMGIVIAVATVIALASLDTMPGPHDPAPASVMWLSVGVAVVMCGSYIAQIVAAFVFAARARRGELARYPLVSKIVAEMLPEDAAVNR